MMMARARGVVMNQKDYGPFRGRGMGRVPMAECDSWGASMLSVPLPAFEKQSKYIKRRGPWWWASRRGVGGGHVGHENLIKPEIAVARLTVLK